MVKNGKRPQKYPVSDGPHVGGKPLSELTAKQKAAVIELGLTEEELDTSTWECEQDLSLLRPAEGRAVSVLGFDSRPWFQFAAVVRSKYANWLKRIEDDKRAQQNKSASKPGAGESARKRANHRASSSNAVSRLRTRSMGEAQEAADGGDMEARPA